MSFQAYLTNIESKTGKSPDDFKKIAEGKGFITDGLIDPKIKAGQILQWLKEDYALGHGHSMAIYAWLKGKKE